MVLPERTSPGSPRKASVSADPVLYRALFEVGSDPVLLIEDGCVIDANPRAQAALGEARDALVGRELPDLLAPVQLDGRTSAEAVAELTATAFPDSPRRAHWLFGREREPFHALVRVQGLAVGERRVLSLWWRPEAGLGPGPDSVLEGSAGRCEQRISRPNGGWGQANDGALSRGVPDTERGGALGIDRETDSLAAHCQAVPIEAGGAAIGALGVYSDPQVPLGAEDRRLLESISHQASEALQRARLLEEARDRARRERLIRDIADRMQRATDLESLIRVAAEELVRALGASRAYVRMGMPEELVQE
jgi:GAF domain-containing protein